MVGKLATLLTEAGMTGPEAMVTALKLVADGGDLAEGVAAKLEQDLKKKRPEEDRKQYAFDVV